MRLLGSHRGAREGSPTVMRSAPRKLPIDLSVHYRQAGCAIFRLLGVTSMTACGMTMDYKGVQGPRGAIELCTSVNGASAH
jgi:hypothetical protein